MTGEPECQLWGATVIDGRLSEPLRDALVTIAGGRIVSVQQGPPADSAPVLDLRGKYLVPGLIDAHAHAEEEWVFSALLASGITTIRNPATRSDRTPTTQIPVSMRCAGPLIDGPAGVGGYAAEVASEAEIRAEVRRQAAAGVDYIKLYNRLSPPLVKAGVEEAHELGLQVIGDLAETSWIDAARAGIDFLCHAIPRNPALLPAAVRESYRREVRERRAHPYVRWVELLDLEGSEMAELIAALVDGGVAVDPTLVGSEAMLFCGDPAYHVAIAPGETLLPEQLRAGQKIPSLSPAALAQLRAQATPVWEKVLAFVGILHASGVTILAGSDSPRPWIVPGASLHRELALLVRAGLSPLDALRAATGGAADALGLADETGAIAPGRQADLVLLHDDPLGTISNTASVEWIMKAGIRHSPKQLRSAYD